MVTEKLGPLVVARTGPLVPFHRTCTGPGVNRSPVTVTRVPDGPNSGLSPLTKACVVHAHAKLAAPSMTIATAAVAMPTRLNEFMFFFFPWSADPG